MSSSLIADHAEFENLCDEIRAEGLVAFDTEFISEYRWKPELCLLQFATRRRVVAVDPYAVEDLSAWWRLMEDPAVTVVVHGGQAEIRFCLWHGTRRPGRLVDVQLAEGLRSRSYPLGYAALVSRVLGERVHGKETRSDWRRRPLSPQQIEYALEDVSHLLHIWDRQRESLASQDRLWWAESEFERMIEEAEAERTRESWTRLPGAHRLPPRDLAVLRELSNWRDLEASRRDRPIRRILRDDLLVELARRQPTTVTDVLSTRDMNRPEYRRIANDLIECIAAGLAVPESDLPSRPHSPNADQTSDEAVLGQFLSLALTNRCFELNVARQLVATSADLRHLVRWHVDNDRRGGPPRLTDGWRAVVCGDLLTDVLDGRISVRVADPESDHPLAFERKA